MPFVPSSFLLVVAFYIMALVFSALEDQAVQQGPTAAPVFLEDRSCKLRMKTNGVVWGQGLQRGFGVFWASRVKPTTRSLDPLHYGLLLWDRSFSHRLESPSPWTPREALRSRYVSSSECLYGVYVLNMVKAHGPRDVGGWGGKRQQVGWGQLIPG